MQRYIILFAVIAGCGNAPTIDDDSMGAEEHRATATEHHQHAVTHDSQSQGTIRSADPIYGIAVYDLDNYHDGLAGHHHSLAKQHAAAAERLEAFEDAQCLAFPKATRTRCPLMGTVAAASDVENGVDITLVEGVNVDAVAAHVECHHAFARVEGRKGMDTCPMYVDGFKLERVGSVLRMTTSPDKADELRKRTKAHLITTDSGR